jgi:hypothetical protein
MLRSVLCKGLTATAGVALGLGVFALPSSAAEPAVTGCVGSTVAPLASTAASIEPGLFGQAIVSFAQNDIGSGFGTEIQALEAGIVPDAVVPNTCND